MTTKVKNLKLLEAMEKAGHITLHGQTGKRVYWNGQYSTAWYIDDGESWFKFRNKLYYTEYYSGCFNPFVVEVEKP